MLPNVVHVFFAATTATCSIAFTLPPVNRKSNSNNAIITQLASTVDPRLTTKKEFEDICGVTFQGNELDRRLERTSYLYPKHVEVIEDIAHVADAMVSNIVSFFDSKVKILALFSVLVILKSNNKFWAISY